MKVFANGKLEIHQAMLLMLIEGEEVNQRAQTMGDQNQGTEKNLQTNRKVLELWRKRSLLDRVCKEKAELQTRG